MRVLCLNPPYTRANGRFSRASRSPAISKSGTLYYPLWLAYAAGLLESEFLVKLLDAEAEGWGLREVVEVSRYFKPDLIVVSTSTPSIENDAEICDGLKQIVPQAHIVMIGTHPSAMPEKTLQEAQSIDSVVRGEADKTLLELARALDQGRSLQMVAGLSYKSGATIVHNNDRPLIEKLDELPFVSDVYRRHLSPNKYFFAAAQHPMVMIITGRGCPNHCFFCVYPQTIHGNRYRYRSAQNVVEEFKYIATNMPHIRNVGIEDDTFTTNRKRVREVCRLLIKNGLEKRLGWWSNSRVDLDLETMRLMKRAGCRLLIPGFESGVQRLLDNMHKGITLEQSRAFMRNARQAGVLVHGCFVVGAPGETEQTMQQTLDFAIELDPDTAQFFPIIPYPGTDAYAWASQNNLLRRTRFSDWLTPEGLHNTVFDGESLTAERMVEFCDQARRAFYLRPSYLVKKARQSLLHPQEAKRTLRSARVFLKYLLPFKRARRES